MGVLSSLAACFSAMSYRPAILSRTFSVCLVLFSIFSSVSSSSSNCTISLIERAPLRRSSAMAISSLITIGERVIVFSTSSWPRSMRLAMATSPSRVSSGTVPISRRYMRTGSLVFSSRPGVRSSSTSSRSGGLLFGFAFGGFRGFQCRARGLGGGDVFVDVDAVSLEGGKQIVDLFRGVYFRGQDVVDFVVEQVAPLLAHVDELAYLIVFFF